MKKVRNRKTVSDFVVFVDIIEKTTLDKAPGRWYIHSDKIRAREYIL